VARARTGIVGLAALGSGAGGGIEGDVEIDGMARVETLDQGGIQREARRQGRCLGFEPIGAAGD
jgi:hypothetical protein